VTSLNQSPVEAGGGWSVSFGSDVGSTDTLFAVVTGYNNSNVTISSSGPTFDGTAGTGSQAPSKILEKLYSYDGTVTDYVAVWMLPPPSGGWPSSAGPLAVTVTNSLAFANVGIIAFDVAGLGTSPTVDQLITADGFTTSPSSGTTAAIQFANEFVLGVLVQDQALTVNPGSPWSTFTGTGGDYNSIASYVLPSSSGSTYTYSATVSPAARWAAGVVTVYAPSGTTHTATAALTVSPSFSAVPQRGKYRTGALTVVPAFSAARVQGHVRTAALTVTPVFRAVPSGGAGRPAVTQVPDSDEAREFKRWLLWDL